MMDSSAPKTGESPTRPPSAHPAPAQGADGDQPSRDEIERLKQRVAELEAQADRLRLLHDHDVYYQDLLDTTHDAVFLYGNDNRIFYANEQAARLTGYSVDELAHLSVRDLIIPEEHSHAQQMRDRILAGERLPLYLRTGLHKDGSTFTVEINSAVLRSADGQVRYLYSFVRDVSDRLQAEADREQLIAELDAFAHTVAHDIKGPLHVISGFAELLHDDATAMSAEEIQLALESIYRYGVKLTSIVDELLLLAGVRQTQEVAVEPTRVEALLDDALHRLAGLIDEHRASISQPDSWPRALGYAPWLEEVWVNYISNAIKYGGQPPQVELGATELPDGMVRFWVRDNGPGIAPDEQARLFVPFIRLDTVRATGYGLGLSIVQRIVERLGGEVGVDSSPGQGSAFWFTLPAA